MVILEPKLTRNGEYVLKTTGKLYDEFGNFDQTIYSKLKYSKLLNKQSTRKEKSF